MKVKPERVGFLIAFFIGFQGMVAQILLFRELMSLVSGNELSVGLMLFFWLFIGSIGSILASWVIKNRDINPDVTFFICWLILLGLILSFTIIAVRASRLFFPFGEEIPPYTTIFSLAIFLIPFCLINGAGFPLIVSSNFWKPKDIDAPSKSFLWESIGSGIAGFMLTILMVTLLTPLMLSLLSTLFSSIILILLKGPKAIYGKVIGKIAIGSMLFISISFPFLSTIELKSMKLLWPGSRLLEFKDSHYSRLILIKQGNQLSLYQAGSLAFSYPSRRILEESFGIPLLFLDSPREVLLLGGGIGGALGILRDDPRVKSIDYVEIDREIINIISYHLPIKFKNLLRDKKVHLYIDDPFRFLRKNKKRYDIIFMALSQPINGQTSSYYSLEFFSKLKTHIKDNGIFSFAIDLSEEFLGHVEASYVASLYKTLSSAFSHTIFLPCNRLIFMASDGNGLEYKEEILRERLKKFGMPWEYLKGYVIGFDLTPFKILQFEEIIEKVKNTKINHSWYPIIFFYNLVKEISFFKPELRISLLKLINFKASYVYIGWFSIFLILFIILRKKGRVFSIRVLLFSTITITGTVEMATEIMTLILYQISYGILYHEIGLLLGIFMMGLAIGAWQARIKCRKRFFYFPLSHIQLYLSILAISAIIIFFSIEKIMLFSGISGRFLFLFLMFSVGFLGGNQFSKVMRIVEETGAGILYGLDLLGASIGAFAICLFFVPVFGLIHSLIWLSFLNVSIGLLLLKEGL